MASASRHAARFVKQGLFLRAGGRAAPVLGPFGSCLQEDNGHGPTDRVQRKRNEPAFFAEVCQGESEPTECGCSFLTFSIPRGFARLPIPRSTVRGLGDPQDGPYIGRILMPMFGREWKRSSSPLSSLGGTKRIQAQFPRLFNWPGWQAHSGRRFIAQGLRSPKSRPRLSLPVWSYTAPGLRR